MIDYFLLALTLFSLSFLFRHLFMKNDAKHFQGSFSCWKKLSFSMPFYPFNLFGKIEVEFYNPFWHFPINFYLYCQMNERYFQGKLLMWNIWKIKFSSKQLFEKMFIDITNKQSNLANNASSNNHYWEYGT